MTRGISGGASVPCRCKLIALAASAIIALVQSSAPAGEWPQILGPHRNGQADGEQLDAEWPASGPATVWERKVGEGFAGLAVVKGTAVLFHRVKNRELIEALNPLTGKEIWKKEFPSTYRGSISEDNGPRCVPTVVGDRVIVYGAQGDLHCLALKSGDEIWSRQAFQDYKAEAGYFGAGSTPLVEGDKVLVNVGGDRQDAGLVAFSLQDGKTVWKGLRAQASYSAPIAVTVDGVRHVIAVTRLQAYSIDPENGNVRFQFPFGRRGPTVNAALPVVIDGKLFLTAHYGIGAVFTRIGKTEAEQLWESNDVLSSQYTTPVYHNGYLYGVDGQDGPGVELRCIDPQAEKIVWSERGFGMASLLVADDKLVILKTSGELVLAKPSPEKYQQLARASVLRTTTRALPALSNGLLYVRDTNTLKCLEVGKRAE